ncbi:unnamed protein product [Parajaminaea phylloscopi]
MTDRHTTEIPAKIDVLGQHVKFPNSGLEAKNRFLKAAMTERLSSWDDEDITKRGIPSAELIKLYEEWGKGGFGVILSGNTFGQYTNLESKGNAILRGDEPERFEAFKKMTDAAKAHGSLYIVQLSHGGRQVPSDINPYPVAPSDVHLTKMGGHDVTGRFGRPTALDKARIKEVVDDFANAALFAHRTGASGVQLHGAHGYLVASFLSPSTNQRTDEYGGSLENRARIVFEMLDAIREKVPDPKFLLGIKLNSVEFQQGGFTAEECRDLCSMLEQRGVDFIELSGGTYEELAFGPSRHQKRDSTKKREAFFLEFADIIRSGIKKSQLYVTGGFRSVAGMIEAVESGSTVGVGLGRPVCEEVDLPNKILAGQVGSSRKTLISEDDFMTGNAVACYQLKQIGQGKKPVDTLKEEELQPVLKELGLASA